MKKVLIIEDDKSIAELEQDYLEINGFKTEIALTGTTGLEKALNMSGNKKSEGNSNTPCYSKER